MSIYKHSTSYMKFKNHSKDTNCNLNNPIFIKEVNLLNHPTKN
jgi:hypothetical protein